MRAIAHDVSEDGLPAIPTVKFNNWSTEFINIPLSEISLEGSCLALTNGGNYNLVPSRSLRAVGLGASDLWCVASRLG